MNLTMSWKRRGLKKDLGFPKPALFF